MKIYLDFPLDVAGWGIVLRNKVTTEIKNLLEDELPYSLALKAEINLLGRESLKLGFVARKSIKQWSYTGVEVENVAEQNKIDKASPFTRRVGTDVKSTNKGAMVVFECDSDTTGERSDLRNGLDDKREFFRPRFFSTLSKIGGYQEANQPGAMKILC
ncbi:hypothetical protein PVK06_008891 [Gossypium arboreum]|uniref:Uncharacterized protein n=1 Tax=Gossypium arboreum TaxID=29729 RepID=A0ABR0QL26_GOSAR|nr:hypothetical protein PVK06_008891 [Gossypium arboreum]